MAFGQWHIIDSTLREGGQFALAAPDVSRALCDGDRVQFDPIGGVLRRGGERFELPAPLDFLRDVLAAGSALALYRA